MNRSIEEYLAATSDIEEVESQGTLEEKLLILAKSRMGYAQFGYVPYKYIDYINDRLNNCKLTNGDIVVIYPARFKSTSKHYNYLDIIKNKDKFIKELEDELQEYPKYKDINFGSVKFINEARIEELQSIIEISNSKEDIVVAYEEKIKTIISENELYISELKSSIEEKETKIDRLKEQIEKNKLKNSENDALIAQINFAFEKKIQKLEYELERKEVMLARPRKTEDVALWVDKCFTGKLIFHDRAKTEIKDTLTKDINMELLCNAIEYLANEYRDELIGKITIEQRNKFSSRRYNRLFEVGPSGEKNINAFSKDYKIK